VIVDNPQTKVEVETQFAAYERGLISSNVGNCPILLCVLSRIERGNPDLLSRRVADRLRPY